MRRTRRLPVVRLAADGTARRQADVLAAEEPMELRVDGTPWTVTMRTPGDDFDLALGFLVSEGVVQHVDQVVSVGYGPGVNPDGSASYNIVDARLAVSAPHDAHRRHVYTSSACGICGISSIEAVTRTPGVGVTGDELRLPLDALLAMTDRLRAGQDLFERTGGVHAAALFVLDDAEHAELICVREDVGRHNAVDKVVGWALRERGLPPGRAVLQVSGRASFELVQKAHMAGIRALTAVSAPSALAVDLATEAGITLVGFSRGRGANVYSRADRITGLPG